MSEPSRAGSKNGAPAYLGDDLLLWQIKLPSLEGRFMGIRKRSD